MFPNLFELAVDKERLVNSMLRVKGGRVVWNLFFCRNLQDWEDECCLLLFDKLYSQQIDSSRDDKVRWEASSSKSFSVKSYFQLLSGRDGYSFPWRFFWRSQAPCRVAFFA